MKSSRDGKPLVIDLTRDFDGDALTRCLSFCDSTNCHGKHEVELQRFVFTPNTTNDRLLLMSMLGIIEAKIFDYIEPVFVSSKGGHENDRIKSIAQANRCGYSYAAHENLFTLVPSTEASRDKVVKLFGILHIRVLPACDFK